MLERTGTGYGFDAADSGSDRLFTDNFQDADIANAVNMRAAAKFLAVKTTRSVGIGNGYHAHVVLGIFVAKKSEGAGGQGVFKGSYVGFNSGVHADFFVDLLLDVAKFLRIDSGEVSEIK